VSLSCNPAFYAIGLKLDQADPGTLPAFARAFGLGQPTGVQGIEEAAGVVPDPEWKQRQIGQPWTHGDAVNLAIGQGYLLATPLQVANAYAALANGGTLRTPLLMKSVRGEDGNEQPVTAQERGRLPISDATRAAILEGMRRATSTPNGTAASAFRGSRVQSAAKTGSAENEGERAHAWIVGFATPQQPAVLALVMVERGEQSSTVAAPLGRQVLEHAYERRQK
jgi:penicillin-binding protein 2